MKDENNEKRSYGLHNTIFNMISKLSYNNRTKIITIAILVPLVMIISTLFYSYNVLQTEYKYNQMVMDQLYSDKADLLSYAIKENADKAEVQADLVKTSIVKDLYQEYNGDKEAMKRDFNLRDNNRFYQILSKNIDDKFLNVKNDNNRMYIATKEGILIDDSLNYSKNSFKPWSDIIKDTPNKVLAKDAIDIIQKKKNATVILWIDNTGTVLNRIQYEDTQHYSTDMTFTSFVEQIVSENNMDELLQYNVIVVSYIFDSEDIFGVPNIVAGQRMDNDVIYVIQTFNIHDMIESNIFLKNSLLNYDIQIEKYNTLFANNANMRVTMCILFVIIEAIGFFCVWYLAEFFVYFHNPKKEDNTKYMKKV